MTSVATPVRARVDGRIDLWCRDLISCLQATFATVLLHAGHDPLEALGLHWEFRHIPGDVTSEEFYFPCALPGDLAGALLPHHPVASRWHEVTGDDRPLAALGAELARGRPVIAAVDNFHLPFRPAFGDVHAAHLIVVYGIDERDGTVHVSDAMPPAFSGAIPVGDFLRAWSSANPSDAQDAFFSDSPIGRRWLAVEVTGPCPPLDHGLLRRAIDHSLTLFHRPPRHEEGHRTGLAGLRVFLETLNERAAADDGTALREAYPFGWGMQAQASLHGELLRAWGHRQDVPAVREAGRTVESVAHAWTGLRICAAHGHPAPRTVAAELAVHARRLQRAHESAVHALTEAREAL